MTWRISWLKAVVRVAVVLAVLGPAAVGQAQPVYLEGPPPAAEQALSDGKNALNEGQYNNAVGLLNQAIRLADQEYAEAHLRVGQAYMELEDFQRAVTAFQTALQQKEELTDDQQAEAYNGLGEAFLEFGLEGAAAALQNFAQAAQIGYKNPEYLLNLGLAHVKVRDPEGAIKVLDQAIALDDRLAMAYATRGQAHGLLAQVRPEDLDLALADFGMAIQLDPDDKAFYYDLGMVLLQSERLEQAFNAFTQAILKDQEQAARRKQSELPSQAPPALTPTTPNQDQPEGTAPANPVETPPGQDQPAEAAAPPASQRPPKRADEGPYLLPLLGRALTSIELGKGASGAPRNEALDRAVADIDLALALAPPVPDALLIRGVAQRLKEDYAGAVASLTEALSINPEYSEALFRRGIVWYYQGEYGLALADLMQASQIAPEDARNHVWQGFAHASQGDYYEAVKAYGRALEQDERFQPAFDNRGLAYLQLGQYEKAIQDFNESIRLNPDDAGAYLKRGVAYDLMSDYDQSAASYRSAVQIDADNVAAYRRLAEAYEKLGRPAEARQARQEADAARRRSQQAGQAAPPDQVKPEVPEPIPPTPDLESLPNPATDGPPGTEAESSLELERDLIGPPDLQLEPPSDESLFPAPPRNDDSNAPSQLNLFQ